MVIHKKQHSCWKPGLGRLVFKILLCIAFSLQTAHAQDLVLENMTISSTETYTASNSITAGPNFIITNTGIVTLKSGNFISLKPSFIVIGGGQLYALTGVSTKLAGKEVNEPINHFDLRQNFPNPFNPTTKIEFSLAEAAEVKLRVFNILGEELKTLVSDNLTAGEYSYEWDASIFPSGLYLYRLSAGNFVETKKMVLMK